MLRKGSMQSKMRRMSSMAALPKVASLGSLNSLRAKVRLPADATSALRSARLPVNLIGSPITHANRLIGSPITSQNTAAGWMLAGCRMTGRLHACTSGLVILGFRGFHN